MRKKDMMKRQNGIIILRALYMGIIIANEHNEFCMDSEFNICSIGRCGSDGSDVLLRINFGDFTVSQFVNWCNSFTDSEIGIIACNVVLNEEKK